MAPIRPLAELDIEVDAVLPHDALGTLAVPAQLRLHLIVVMDVELGALPAWRASLRVRAPQQCRGAALADINGRLQGLAALTISYINISLAILGDPSELDGITS